MSASDKLITVGITAYNEGDMLREAWESIAAQDSDDWEAVLVLDHTDHQPTIDIFDSLEHPRLRKIKNDTNLGPYPSMQRAVEMTQTPYFAFLGGDDMYAPGAVRAIAKAVQESTPDFFCGDWRLFGENMKPWIVRGHLPALENVIDRGTCPCVTGWTKAVFGKVGGYPQELARGRGDLDLVVSLIESCASGMYIPEVLYEYRQKAGSGTSTSYPERLGAIAEIIVNRHPKAFADKKRRQGFLVRHYAEQAWTLYWQNDIARAAAAACRVVELGGERKVWPLQLLKRFPPQAIWPLMLIRKIAAHLFRWPIVSWR